MPIGIIPARYGSKRFPGKPLAVLAGKPLIQHTYEKAMEASKLSRVAVATDDVRIARVVEGFGGEAIMTSHSCKSGTERVVEAANGLARILPDIIVNIQGDEPLVCPQHINKVVELLETKETDIHMSTLASKVGYDEATSKHSVKCVLDRNCNALYFSRAIIPFDADDSRKNGFLRHIGIYGFRREFLLNDWPRLGQCELQQREDLEQLAVLENGYKIRVGIVTQAHPGVDTPGGLENVKTIMNAKS